MFSGGVTLSAGMPQLFAATPLPLTGFVFCSAAVAVMASSIALKLQAYTGLDDPMGILALTLISAPLSILGISLLTTQPSAAALMLQLTGMAAYALCAFLPALCLFTLIEVLLGIRKA